MLLPEKIKNIATKNSRDLIITFCPIKPTKPSRPGSPFCPFSP